MVNRKRLTVNGVSFPGCHGPQLLNATPWIRSRRLVREIYDLTSNSPDNERCGLTSQIRRACTSVPLNLSEGSGRLTNGEWQLFLGYARGSLLELEAALILAFDLGHATREQLEPIGERKYRRISVEEVCR